MISIGICDNNDKDIDSLRKEVELFFSNSSYPYEINIFKGLNDLHKFYSYDTSKKELGLDILFCNYCINNGSGFKIVKFIREFDDEVAIVGVCDDTSYIQESYDVWSLSYEVKPIKANRLEEIMNRFFKYSARKEEQGLLVKIGAKYIKLFYDEICYIESQNTVLRIHMNNYEIIKTYGKLDDLETEISNKRFLRCHKSFLINMDYIKIAEAYKFTTIFGDSVSIKQREASAIKKTFYEYKRNKYFLEKSK